MTLNPAFILCLALLLPGAAHASMESDALTLINAERARAGCQALTAEPRLEEAAQGHALAMAQKNFFGHAGPNGATFTTWIKDTG